MPVCIAAKDAFRSYHCNNEGLRPNRPCRDWPLKVIKIIHTRQCMSNCRRELLVLLRAKLSYPGRSPLPLMLHYEGNLQHSFIV